MPDRQVQLPPRRQPAPPSGVIALPGDLPAILSEEEYAVARIKWTTLARVVLISLMVTFAVLVDLGVGPQRAADQPEVLLYQLAAGAYSLSFILLLATLLGRTNAQSLARIAWASVAADIALALALVYVTDGLQSLFQFCLPLAVLNAAVLLGRSGAIGAAALASVGMATMAMGEVGWLTLPALRVAYLGALAPRQAMETFEVMADLALQVASAHATALLSSHLLRELDRTRRRALQSRRELATLKVRYEDVVSSLPDGLLTLDAKGAITSVNPAAEAIVGVDAQDVYGKLVEQVLPELAQVCGSESGEWEIARSAPIPVSPTQQVLRQSPDGRQQILACRVARLRDQGGSWGRVVVLRDMTEARSRDEAHRARERLAAIGSMATAVAHEIRNPLASISGAVQLLQSGASVSDADRPLMQIVVRETSQLSEWIDEFLEFAKPRRAIWASVDLHSLLTETVQACGTDPRVVAAGVQLSVQTEPDQANWLLVGDAVLLRQVAWNLLINACQAVLAVDRRQVKVSLTASADGLTIAVEDSGPGIDEKELPFIFEPFHTTKAEGTGLGLATVRRHVELHRGEITAGRSASLGGALMQVWLPRHPPADPFSDTSRPSRTMPAAQVPAISASGPA